MFKTETANLKMYYPSLIRNFKMKYLGFTLLQSRDIKNGYKENA